MKDHHEFFRLREQQERGRTLLPPRYMTLNRSANRRQGEGQDDFLGTTSQDWGTLRTIPRQSTSRVAALREEACGGSLPNILKQMSSASNSSLGSETGSKSVEELQQREDEEEKRRRDEEHRQEEEIDRIQQVELEQKRLAEENNRQLQIQAAALGVDPSLVPFLTDLLVGIASSTPLTKVWN